MEETKITVKSFWMYGFAGFITVNLFAMKQIFGVQSISTNNAFMPLIIAFCISIIYRILIILNLKDAFFPQPADNENSNSKCCNFLKFVSTPSPFKYSMICILFFVSCVLCLVFAARVFDGLEQLSKLVDENRRKERAGMAGDDLEYLAAEDQISISVGKDKAICFLMMYAIVASYALLHLLYKNIETRYLESIGDFTARNNEQESSGLSWSGISSTISSWSVICSGGACYNVGSNALGSISSSVGVSLSFLSHIILPITIVLICISIYSLRKQSCAIMISGVIGGLIIIISSMFELGFTALLIGNIILICTSIIAAKKKKKGLKYK